MKSETPDLFDLISLWFEEDGGGYHLREWHMSPNTTWRYLCAGLNGTKVGKVYKDRVELKTINPKSHNETTIFETTTLRPEDPEFFDKLKHLLRVAAFPLDT